MELKKRRGFQKNEKREKTVPGLKQRDYSKHYYSCEK